VGAFSQDVSALSHETAEWADDPLVVNTSGNQVACGILEVGDPEEGFTNYGGFPYTLNGFTYNLQDLAQPLLVREELGRHAGPRLDHEFQALLRGQRLEDGLQFLH